MLSTKQQRAIELLFVSNEVEVARALGMRCSTVYRWLGEPKFSQALKDAQLRQHRSLLRIAGSAAIAAAKSLCAGIDSKTALEVLKLSKAFEPEQINPAEALAELVRKIKESCESENANTGTAISKIPLGMESAPESANMAIG